MRFTYTAVMVASLGAFGLCSAVQAADKPINNRGARAQENKAKLDKKTDGDTLRLSQVCGMTIRNTQGKDLGDIKDVMLDMGDHGCIRYAALSFGGFLGMGDKLFAIPWSALKFRHDTDADETCAIFDTTEEMLKKTPGFDKNQWPDMADRRWMDEVDKHHHVDVAAGDTEVHVRSRDADRQDKGQPFRLHRASEIKGMSVRNDHNDKLGKVEDIVVAPKSGDIRYVALSFGGFLGIGDKFFAVPFDAVRFAYDADGDDYYIACDVTKDQLEKAQGFDKDHWPNFGDKQWVAGNDRHYTAQRNRRERETTNRSRVK